MTFQPSPQQQAIFDAIARGDENLIVEAVAGSGKTTTIVEGTKRIPRGTDLLAPSVVFLAFNKSIADTLKTKLPRGVQSSTFHSLGLRALKNSGVVERNVEIKANKCAKWIYNAMDRNDPDVRAVTQLVSLAKSRNPHTSPTFDSRLFWQDIVQHHDIVLEESERAFTIAAKVLEKSNATSDEIDFDDMLYLPVLHNCAFDKQDWIFVDEAQDTNDIQLEILERLCKRDSRMISTGNGNVDWTSSTRLLAVGDPRQAIYGFRGANSDSMSRIAKRFSCKTYPLSVSYRCSRAVVAEAQKYLKWCLNCETPDATNVKPSMTTIKPHADAVEGEVKTFSQYDDTTFEKGSLILCRNTAPLIAFAYSLLQRDIPCRILGRDIGRQLADIVKKRRALSLSDLQEKLLLWHDREFAAVLAADRSPERIDDQYSCLLFFINGLDDDSQTIDSLLAKIDLMFTDDSNGASASRITLSTVHKAKGLEFDTVFILDRAKYMPSKYAKQAWQIQQEYNLLYVAVTRAKTNLIYIDSEAWKNGN